MADEAIIVQPVVQYLTVVDNPQAITVAAPGPQGPAGPSGSSAVFFIYTQNSPSAVWTIDHNLDGHPTAVVLDSAGTQCEGTFSYPSTNQMIITFTAAFSGVAYII